MKYVVIVVLALALFTSLAYADYMVDPDGGVWTIVTTPQPMCTPY